MLKAMIVDDEMLVRVGLRTLIDWESLGFVCSADAADGLEAMERIAAEPPDLILTDIVMPRMNGLRLIEEVRARYPSIRFIVLSTHTDYEYVRKAMKSGADDYILKASMKPQDLAALIGEAGAKIRNERMELAMDKSSGEDASRLAQFMALLDGAATGAATGVASLSGPASPTGSASSNPAGLSNPAYSAYPAAQAALSALFATPPDADHPCLLMAIRVHRDSAEEGEDTQAHRSLAGLAEQQLRKWPDSRLIRLAPSRLAVLLPLAEGCSEQRGQAGRTGEADPNGEAARNARAALELGEAIISAARRFLDLTASVGISAPMISPAEVKRAYDEAKRASRLSFYKGKGRVYAWRDEPFAPATRAVFAKAREDELTGYLARNDEEMIRASVTGLIDELREAQMPVKETLKVCLDIAHCMLRACKQYGFEMTSDFQDGAAEMPIYERVLSFETLSELEDWFLSFISLYSEHVKEIKRNTFREEIGRLVDYVRVNYREDLSLKSAAKIVNMSESYLSYVFKKETGTGFSEYVNQVRVDAASVLLKETDLPSYQIAETVGYDNINYFGRVFKRLTGITPSQYRSRYE